MVDYDNINNFNENLKDLISRCCLLFPANSLYEITFKLDKEGYDDVLKVYKKDEIKSYLLPRTLHSIKLQINKK